MEKKDALLGLASFIDHIILHTLPLNAKRHKWLISGDTLADANGLMIVNEGDQPIVSDADLTLYVAIRDVVCDYYNETYWEFNNDPQRKSTADRFERLHMVAGLLVDGEKPGNYQNGQQLLDNYKARIEQEKKESTDNWDVSVGNVGLITCDNEKEARDLFERSKERSIKGIGREAYEPVVLLCNSEIVEEYTPNTIDNS